MAEYVTHTLSPDNFVRKIKELYEEYTNTITDPKITEQLADYLIRFVKDEVKQRLADEIGRELIPQREYIIEIESPIECTCKVGAISEIATLECGTEYLIKSKDVEGIKISNKYIYKTDINELPIGKKIELLSLFKDDDLIIILPYLGRIGNLYLEIMYFRDTHLPPDDLTKIEGFHYGISRIIHKEIQITPEDIQRFKKILEDWCKYKRCKIKEIKLTK